MSLVTGADPEYIIRVAAVSPTFGRLFEGLTRLRRVKPRRPRCTSPKRPAASQQPRLPRPNPVRPKETRQMLRNSWHSYRKLLASCNAVSDRNGADNEARMADRLAVQTTYAGCLAGPIKRAVVLSTPVDNMWIVRRRLG